MIGIRVNKFRSENLKSFKVSTSLKQIGIWVVTIIVSIFIIYFGFASFLKKFLHSFREIKRLTCIQRSNLLDHILNPK